VAAAPAEIHFHLECTQGDGAESIDNREAEPDKNGQRQPLRQIEDNLHDVVERQERNEGGRNATALMATTPRNACANRQRNCGPGLNYEASFFFGSLWRCSIRSSKRSHPAIASQGEAERDN
jgi:hypothetical protein